MTDFGPEHMVQHQRECQRCPLHRNGSVSVDVPFGLIQGPLVVFSHALLSVGAPRHDGRLAKLIRKVPELEYASVTYTISCRLPAGKEIPERAKLACMDHRKIELSVLRPSILVLIGDRACETYLGASVAQAGYRTLTHATGSLVYAVASVEEDLTGLREAVSQVSAAFDFS